jgi:hypothetical protein
MRLGLVGSGRGLVRVLLRGLCRGGWLARTIDVRGCREKQGGGDFVIGLFEFAGCGGGVHT